MSLKLKFKIKVKFCPKDVKCGVDIEVLNCPSLGKSEKFKNKIRKRIYIKSKTWDECIVKSLKLL